MSRYPLSMVLLIASVFSSVSMSAAVESTPGKQNDNQPKKPGLEITLVLDQNEYRWDEGVSLKMVFTNHTKKKLALPTHLTMVGLNVYELTYELKHGSNYSVFRSTGHQGIPGTVIEPGKQFVHHIGPLRHKLYMAKIRQLNGKKITGYNLPKEILDEAGDYQLTVTYGRPPNALAKRIFDGVAKSNTVSFRRITKEQLTKAAMQAYRKHPEKFSFAIRYHQPGNEGENKSVWLWRSQANREKYHARVRDRIPKKTVDRIVAFLNKQEFFANARNVDEKTLWQTDAYYYSWQVYGLDKKVYYLFRSLDQTLMADLERLSEILGVDGIEVDAVLKEWEPLRKKWRKADDYVKEAEQGMAFGIITPHPKDAKKTYEFWFVGSKFTGKLPKATGPREVHRVTQDFMGNVIGRLRYDQFFLKCQDKQKPGRAYWQVVTKKCRLAQHHEWKDPFKTDVWTLGHLMLGSQFGADPKDDVFAAFSRFLRMHCLPIAEWGPTSPAGKIPKAKR